MHIMTNENLGPAERIIQSLLAYSDHMVHNRPGIVVADARTTVGVRWEPVTHKEEGEPKQKVVYRLVKAGKKTNKVRVGVMQPDNKVVEGRTVVGNYMPAGLFPEVAIWMYRQVAEVWKLDNAFAARWASHAFAQEHRDLKVVLAAFMLCQSRKGDPVLDDGKVAFRDEDFRDVGEAMCLLQVKDKDLSPKLLLRIHDLLTLPGIAEINRELGFGRSARKPFHGRWEKVVDKWLRFREQNPKVLEGLVKAGFSSTVETLARSVGYKPESPKFFQTLRWKQKQSDDGRRVLAIGKTWEAEETWEGQTEEQICQRIVGTKPNWKVIVSRLPKSVGVTRAIVAAAIEAGSFSNKDLIIATPTLEELGLLKVQDIRDRWDQAVRSAEDMRAANIARNVKSQEAKEKLEEAADNALKKATEEVMKDMRVYVIVDISGSMEGAIEAAKTHIARFLQGFPLDQLHVSVFNTAGRVVEIKHASAAGVTNAFRGITAGGGTDYGAGVRALQGFKPKPEEDTLFIFIGDEGAGQFAEAVRASGLNPMAFGLIPTPSPRYGRGIAVKDTANRLGLSCFEIDAQTFADPYAIPRTIRALIAATPINVTRAAAPTRVTLVDTILKTQLLVKPAWAA